MYPAFRIYHFEGDPRKQETDPNSGYIVGSSLWGFQSPFCLELYGPFFGLWAAAVRLFHPDMKPAWGSEAALLVAAYSWVLCCGRAWATGNVCGEMW